MAQHFFDMHMVLTIAFSALYGRKLLTQSVLVLPTSITYIIDSSLVGNLICITGTLSCTLVGRTHGAKALGVLRLDFVNSCQNW